MHFTHALVNQDAHPHVLQKHIHSSPLCVELCAIVCEEKSNGWRRRDTRWLVDWLLHAGPPLWHGAGGGRDAAVGRFGRRRRRRRCVRVWFFLPTLRESPVGFGAP